MAVAAEPAALETVVAPAPPPPSKKRLGGEQVGVAAGQMAAGAGNLAFALVAARVLDASGFAQLSVFLGLYLVLSLPATSLSAATAVDPGRRDTLLRRVGVASLILAVAGAASSPWLAPLLGLPVVMVVVLAAVVPATAPLALDRGRLYGRQDHLRLITSLVAEPAIRLTVGVALALGVGAIGGAAGVVLGAYAAREVARSGLWKDRRRFRLRRTRRLMLGLDSASSQPDTAAPDTAAPDTAPLDTAAPAGAGEVLPAGPNLIPAAGAAWTAVAFFVLAVIQNQDLIFSNALLPGPRAGMYAALSTLGGAAAFATVTIPLVLLPRAVRGERHSLAVAVGLAAVLGGAAVGIAAAMPATLTDALFGSRYAGVAHLVVPYLAAMALLGVARVLVAHRCATAAPRVVTAILIVVGAGQAAAIVALGTGVTAIAYTTVGATAALTVALGAERLARRWLAGRDLRAWAARLVTDPAARIVVLALMVGVAIRLVTFRGIWLDEATSIHQASLSFSGMLSNLRTTDVHPPLYFSVLWLDVRAFGNGLMALRIPSIIAGTLIIPAAYVTARDLWDRRSGVVAAVLASVGPFIVWYSQEIRMYSMFMLFALLAIWGQTRVLRRGRAADWAIYVLSSAALFWTEYFGCFQVIAQQAFFMAVLWRDRKGRGDGPRLLRGWLLASLAILVLIAPLIPFAWHQFLVNQNAGKGFGAPSQTPLGSGEQAISVYTVLANVTWAVLGYHSTAMMAALVALWPLGILLSIFLLGRNMTRTTIAVVVAALVPLGMLVGAGMEKRFLFDVRYVSGMAVALTLLTARMITGASRSTKVQAAGCAALVAISFAALADEQINGSNPRLFDFAGALQALSHRLQPGDRLLYDPGNIGLVLDYYHPNVAMAPAGNTVPTAAPGKTIFVLASKDLMNGGGPAQLGRILSLLGQKDRPAGTIKKPNVEVWMFVVPPTAQPPSGPPAAAAPPAAAPAAAPAVAAAPAAAAPAAAAPAPGAGR